MTNGEDQREALRRMEAHRKTEPTERNVAEFPRPAEEGSRQLSRTISRTEKGDRPGRPLYLADSSVNGWCAQQDLNLRPSDS